MPIHRAAHVYNMRRLKILSLHDFQSRHPLDHILFKTKVQSTKYIGPASLYTDSSIGINVSLFHI